ncbi:sugar phosphate isomerase/epimerase family protein [Streptomyces luteogriseus]|uniref:sugar phosphate isomerase/epimerase family protein n=1 Tax=Streptomyces luteogriseus TaxID=68233 RepID=UPI003801A694
MSDHLYSVQLYTLRDGITSDLAGTLKRVASMGFENVELWRFEQYRDDYRRALAETRLRPLSAHASLVDGNASAAVRAAAELGIGTLIEPHIIARRWTTRADIEAAAASLNAVARLARDEGVTIGYHNHDHEVRHDFEGRTGLEIFADALDDDVVLELDTFWAEVGGASAVELISRLGARVRFLHVKDGPYTKTLAEQQPVGQGAMPVTDILRAAPEAVRVVELDDYAGDVFAAVQQSLRHLLEVDR